MLFDSSSSYQMFSNEVTRGSRYILSVKSTNFLETLLATSEDRVRVLEKGSVLWRAQLGHDWRPEYWRGKVVEKLPCAFSPQRMKPLENSASEGRANPKGMPYLYLSNDRDTALSEVRPWIGSVISAGKFGTNRELRLFDFSVEYGKARYYPFNKASDEQKTQAVWAQIDNSFSQPVNESDTSSNYVPTQVIAEYIKSKGYDGIVFKSSLAKGHNIALFDLESASILNCSTYEARSLSFDFSEASMDY